MPAGQFALAAYTLRGRMPEGARTLRWYYGLVVDPYPLTVTLADGSETTEWVQGDAWSTSLALGGPFVRPSRWTRLWQYLTLGYRHILPEGLDHILFVLGLFLLRAELRPVLVQVTTFTVAHSLTLALSLYGVVSLPARVVEPLIALSIVYVAVENLRTRTLTPWRVALVFLFGLLHGLGFAGVLTGAGSAARRFRGGAARLQPGRRGRPADRDRRAPPLLVGWWRHRAWYRPRVVVPASLAIAVRRRVLDGDPAPAVVEPAPAPLPAQNKVASGPEYRGGPQGSSPWRHLGRALRPRPADRRHSCDRPTSSTVRRTGAGHLSKPWHSAC